jgi:hypothetical protein
VVQLKATRMFFERSQVESLVVWGSAAWVKTQLTPGVSALAAPRSKYLQGFRERVNRKRSPKPGNRFRLTVVMGLLYKPLHERRKYKWRFDKKVRIWERV